MYPSIKVANLLIEEAEKLNPGPWINHSHICAKTAKEIAKRVKGMDEDKAYVLALLHDIGRRNGKFNARHIMEGYKFLLEMSYDEAAKVCLTHSYPNLELDEYIGDYDIDDDDFPFLIKFLNEVELDDYDKLMQLVDAMCTSKEACSIEKRRDDVKSRYGKYSNEKYKKNLKTKEYFDELIGEDIYKVLKIIE